MSKENLHSIKVEIAGRSYPLFVTDKEREAILLLGEKINEEINDLHARYANSLVKQDIMAMLLLTYGKKMQELEESTSLPSIEDKINQLQNLLSEIPLED